MYIYVYIYVYICICVYMYRLSYERRGDISFIARGTIFDILGSEFPIGWYSLKNTMDTCY